MFQSLLNLIPLRQRFPSAFYNQKMKITTEEEKIESMKKGFRICNNKGFYIKFDNGWTVSVQFGWGNYCDNYNNNVKEMRDFGKYPYASDTAEIWAWKGKKDFLKDPLGYQTPEQVLKFINKIARKKK